MNSENQILDLNETRDLGASMLKSGHQVRFKLGGNSMFPFLKDGDVAVVSQLPIEQLKLGQVVVFQQQGKWIAHRLVEIDILDDKTIQLTARGDSTKRSDHPFTEKEYLGVVLSFQRGGNPHDLKDSTTTVYTKLMLWARPVPQSMIHLFLRVKNRLSRI